MLIPGFLSGRARAAAASSGDSVLFFACLPDSQTATQIEALAKRLRSQRRLKGNPISADVLHVKLHVIGNQVGVQGSVIALAKKAAAAVAMPAFDIAFDRAMTFAGGTRKRPFGLAGDAGLAGLKALHQALGQRMREVGLTRDQSSYYTPRLNLLYVDHLMEECSIDPIGWRVREFALLQRGSAGQQVLERWALTEEIPA